MFERRHNQGEANSEFNSGSSGERSQPEKRERWPGVLRSSPGPATAAEQQQVVLRLSGQWAESSETRNIKQGLKPLWMTHGCVGRRIRQEKKTQEIQETKN